MRRRRKKHKLVELSRGRNWRKSSRQSSSHTSDNNYKMPILFGPKKAAVRICVNRSVLRCLAVEFRRSGMDQPVRRIGVGLSDGFERRAIREFEGVRAGNGISFDEGAGARRAGFSTSRGLRVSSSPGRRGGRRVLRRWPIRRSGTGAFPRCVWRAWRRWRG